MQTEIKKVLPLSGGEDLRGVKKYILKPGRHQFVPGSHAIHHNNNISDEEAEWYLVKYPHIVSNFEAIPKEIAAEQDAACRVSDEGQQKQSSPKPVKLTIQLVESQSNSEKSQNINEDLPPAN